MKSAKFWQNLRDLSTSCQMIIRILPLLEEAISSTFSVCVPRRDVLQAIQILSRQLLQILKVLTAVHFLHAIFNRKCLITEYDNL